MNVSGELVKWFVSNGRDLPWRKQDEPYKIWLSEIILQQTRVDQGMDYYLRFLLKFPTVFHLANAPVEDVLKEWQGLGYYTRARNLHKAAGIIVRQYDGVFPSDYNDIRKLPGIGDYTAAAIASFAFNRPYPAIDGNVFRVLSRFFGIHSALNTTQSRRDFLEAAESILDTINPALHNQAVMELGAIICIPAKPKCGTCPISQSCYAYQNRLTEVLPVRLKKPDPVHRYFYYLVIREGNDYFIRQRKTGDIWALLYEFPLIETGKPVSFKTLLKHDLWKDLLKGNDGCTFDFSPEYRHKLTHQTIHAWFIRADVQNAPTDSLIRVTDLNEYPCPRLIERYLEDQSI